MSDRLDYVNEKYGKPNIEPVTAKEWNAAMRVVDYAGMEVCFAERALAKKQRAFEEACFKLDLLDDGARSRHERKQP